MPPRGVKSPKRKRQYQHIKQSARKRGASTERAEELAARTVNKARRKAGQTKGGAKSRKSSSAGKSSRKSSSSGSRKGSSSSSGRKSSGSRSRSSSSRTKKK